MAGGIETRMSSMFARRGLFFVLPVPLLSELVLVLELELLTPDMDRTSGLGT
jgi:hypothetical protein